MNGPPLKQVAQNSGGGIQASQKVLKEFEIHFTEDVVGGVLSLRDQKQPSHRMIEDISTLAYPYRLLFVLSELELFRVCLDVTRKE